MKPNTGKHLIFILAVAAILITALQGCNILISQPMGRIVFSSSGNHIFWVRETGGEPFQLTDNTNNYSPVWSPDGTKIAFISDRSSTYEIFVMNGDGSGQRNLTLCDQPENTFLCWASDGKKIYFNRNGDGIYEIEIEKNTETRIIQDNQIYQSIMVSPDGTTIAYQYLNASSYNRINIADISTKTNVSLLNSIANVHFRYPIWSPDEKCIYFNYSEGGICKVNAGQENTVDSLSPMPGTDSAGIFTLSPDGKRIAFVNGYDIVIINIDGSNSRIIYTSANEVVEIRWAPDGHRLLVSTNAGLDTSTELVSVLNGSVEMTFTSVANPPSAAFSPR